MAEFTRRCPVCKDEFTTRYHDKVYCGQKCASQVYIAKKKIEYEKSAEFRSEHSERMHAYYLENKARINAANRAGHFRRKYGITIEEREALIEAQNYECAICKCYLKETEPVVDHCKRTKKVRGILCHQCNIGIGLFEDNTEYLQSAIDYLKQSIE